mgnify:CR=1 FL=1
MDAALDAAASAADSSSEKSLSDSDESPPAYDAPSDSGESASKSGSGGSSPEVNDTSCASPIEQQQVDCVPLPEDIGADELVAAKCPALDGTPEWLLENLPWPELTQDPFYLQNLRAILVAAGQSRWAPLSQRH